MNATGEDEFIKYNLDPHQQKVLIHQVDSVIDNNN